MTLKMAFSEPDGVVTVMDADPAKFKDESVKEITALSNAVKAQSAEERRWQLRKESMAESAGIDLGALDAIQAQSGLSWPELELVIATLQITNYRRLYGG